MEEDGWAQVDRCNPPRACAFVDASPLCLRLWPLCLCLCLLSRWMRMKTILSSLWCLASTTWAGRPTPAATHLHHRSRCRIRRRSPAGTQAMSFTAAWVGGAVLHRHRGVKHPHAHPHVPPGCWKAGNGTGGCASTCGLKHAAAAACGPFSVKSRARRVRLGRHAESTGCLDRPQWDKQ